MSSVVLSTPELNRRGLLTILARSHFGFTRLELCRLCRREGFVYQGWRLDALRRRGLVERRWLFYRLTFLGREELAKLTVSPTTKRR